MLGNVTGLVTITPASGSVGPIGAIVIGVTAVLICCYVVTEIKPLFVYDDALGVFSVHTSEGIVRTLLTGIFVAEELGGLGLAKEMSIVLHFNAQLEEPGLLHCLQWDAVFYHS